MKKGRNYHTLPKLAIDTQNSGNVKVESEILRPGLVIDDPSLISSIRAERPTRPPPPQDPIFIFQEEEDNSEGPIFIFEEEEESYQIPLPSQSGRSISF